MNTAAKCSLEAALTRSRDRSGTTEHLDEYGANYECGEIAYNMMTLLRVSE